MARTFARRSAKVAAYLIVMFIVARCLGSAEMYINHELASRVAQLINGDVNAESIYDAYFYIDFISVTTITSFIYFITMKLIGKIRSN